MARGSSASVGIWKEKSTDGASMADAQSKRTELAQATLQVPAVGIRRNSSFITADRVDCSANAAMDLCAMAG